MQKLNIALIIMQNKLAKILFSTRLTATLFIVFAVAMSIGTFMDAGMETSPTPYSRYWIYNAWWFEVIQALFVVNFVGNIFRFRLYKKAKWATLTLHLSFILILFGAFVTRYIGYEGKMPIFEGETENVFLSEKTYVIALINGDYKINDVAQRLRIDQKVDFSERLNNTLNINTTYDTIPVKITLDKFVSNAEKDIIPNNTGKSYLKIVEAGNGAPHNHYLESGKDQKIHNIIFTLNSPKKGAINIVENENGLTIDSPFDGEYLQMANMAQGKLVKDSIQPLMLRSRYIIGNMQMVFPKPVIQGDFGIVKKSKLLKVDEDGIVVNVTANRETKKVNILGGVGTNNQWESIEVGGLDIDLKFGSKVLNLPFSIKLNDFVADKYPGTENSYSAFSSQVTIEDEEKGSFDYKIFMNNVLDHRGYRFFQSGFDNEEKRTILSVNHDFWGTWLTYIGYFLLYFGLMAILFDKNTRFADLRRALNKTDKKKEENNNKAKNNKKEKIITILLLCFTLSGFSQEKHNADDGHNHENKERKRPTKFQIDSILKANVASKVHAEVFSRTVIQDLDGRMMPVHTYASELLRKISKKDSYEGLDANQVFLSIQESPMFWYNVPFIYLTPMKADSIKTIIGVPKTQKYVTLLDFFTDDFQYKLAPYLEEANKNEIKTGYQMEMLKANERFNLLSNTLEGLSLKIFPLPDDANNKWISNYEFRKKGYNEKIKDSTYASFVKNSLDIYFFRLGKAKLSGDYSKAEEFLGAFKKNQQKLGAEVMLTDNKIEAEIKYNKFDVFKKLYRYYILVGIIMFIFLIIQIVKDKNKFIDVSVNVLKYTIFAIFLLHTFGLITRWYISGHVPWTDTYETMLYVAWSSMFFGLALGRKSNLTIASASFMVAIILFFANQSWLDPAIANLQPVLNSYWLMIHVSVIVASYGPFTLGLIIGVVVLVLIILTNEKNKKRMLLNIKELTIVNEMALTVGLVMLTIGNFLGGQWANESWGRYWGWDPKETWALISIMVYAFVIHMRLVPGLRGRWFFNLMTIIAFSSIMMTYFGVNFYLAGLHSYASGDQIVSLKFIAITCAIVSVLGVISYRKYLRYFKK